MSCNVSVSQLVSRKTVTRKCQEIPFPWAWCRLDGWRQPWCGLTDRWSDAAACFNAKTTKTRAEWVSYALKNWRERQVIERSRKMKERRWILRTIGSSVDDWVWEGQEEKKNCWKTRMGGEWERDIWLLGEIIIGKGKRTKKTEKRVGKNWWWWHGPVLLQDTLRCKTWYQMLHYMTRQLVMYCLS